MNIGYIYVLVYIKYYCETHYCLPSPFLGMIYVVREVTIQTHDNYYHRLNIGTSIFNLCYT